MRRSSLMKRGLVLLGYGFLILPLWALSPEEEPVVKVVEKTLPALVNINAERVMRGQVTDPFNQYYLRYFEQRVPSLGSGVLVSADGYILTCAHVVDRAENQKVKVTLANDSTYEAKLLQVDQDIDLALLKIEDKMPFAFLDTKLISPNLLGQTVIALGNPVSYQNSISRGILSAKNRKIKTEQGTSEGLLQTDAAINPGNSGGPLVDIEGRFVGISSAKYSGQAIEGLGFALPAEVAHGWLVDAIAIVKGEKKPPVPVSLVAIIRQRFGMTLQELTPALAQSFGLPNTNGLLIADVEKGTPADKAEVKTGMLIVRIGNVPIASESSIPRLIGQMKTGDPATFTISYVERRGNFTIQRTQPITLQAR
jgi:serine protease Do